MNKKIKISLIILLIAFAIIFFMQKVYKTKKTGNNINKSTSDLLEYILNISSYEATAKVTINSNKTSNEYVIKQYYLKPIYSKQIIKEPQSIENLEILHNGKDLSIKNTNLGLSKIYQNYSIDNRYNFKLEIDDRFDTLSNVSYYELGTEDILIDMYKNSVCIGGVSNRESAFEVNLDSYFEGTIHGTVQTNASDIRLKELVDDDLIPLLKIWDEMTVVLFKYKDYNNKIQAGVIAQEIIELFNKYEIDWKKYGIVYQDPYTGYYSINYEFLNQLSILKVKLLQWKLLSIDQRLEKLENK